MATLPTMTKVIVVVGAGIVGVSTAIWLRRAGHDVTLIDKGAPGMGASYGNVCEMGACAAHVAVAGALHAQRDR